MQLVEGNTDNFNTDKLVLNKAEFMKTEFFLLIKHTTILAVFNCLKLWQNPQLKSTEFINTSKFTTTILS